MRSTIRRMRPGPMIVGAALSGSLLFLLGCPALFPPILPPAEGVTASEVDQLLASKLNTVNRELSLWGIQPGLGTVMIEYGRRIAMMQLAVQAQDWGMAQYQLKEAIEIQEVGETTRSSKAALLASFEAAHLNGLAADIEARDATAFNSDFPAMVQGCNDCHAATDHGFIVVQPPTASPEDFLFLAASEPTAPAEGSGSTAKSLNEKALSWAELSDQIDNAFNTANRDFTLWDIQPGLGTIMMEYGRRFAMLRGAVDAGDWGMAQYQLKEAREIQEVGEITRSGKADLLKNFEQNFLDPIDTAIQATDTAAFNTAFSSAIEGCNGCHVATGHPYVRVQEPLTPPQPFLLAGNSALVPAAEGGESTTTAAAPSFPAGNPTMADAEAMIEDRLNQLDRDLVLWNIQPGLGTVMMEYGHRFALAQLAVQAGNWDMAAYQIKEALEIQEVGETTRPGKADLLKAFEASSVDPLVDDITARDKASFDADFDAAVVGCNDCHQATGHPFVVFQKPAANFVSFLNLAGGQ